MDDAGQKKNVVLKDPGNGVDNYRPISCLPFMWNLSTGGVVSESMYNFLIKNNFLPEEQRGCRKGSWGTKDHLLSYKMILQD